MGGSVMATIINAGQTALTITPDTTGALTIQANGTNGISVTSNGWVGVGTTTPANTFSVKGTGIVAERDVDTDRLIATYNDINIYANATGGTNHNVFTIRHSNNSVTNNRMRITATGLFQFDSGYGDIATAYGVRAWVNFNGSNGNINGSGGVSSVTRNGTGDYTVAYSFTFPSNTYTLWGMGRRNSSSQRPVLLCMNNSFYENTTTGARFYTMLNDSATIEDPIQFWFGAIR